jgi:uncharacterized membrane protein
MNVSTGIIIAIAIVQNFVHWRFIPYQSIIYQVIIILLANSIIITVTIHYSHRQEYGLYTAVIDITDH